MKKFILATAMAVFGLTSLLAGTCGPEEVKAPGKAVYQIQFNIYTTCGKTTMTRPIASSPCTPGEEAQGVVLRGKDKTIVRGYITQCEAACNLNETCTFEFWDSKRGNVPCEDARVNWNFINVIGKNKNDAECCAEVEFTVPYDGQRAQTYKIMMSGFGKYNSDIGVFDNLSGIFAGTATASYDLKTKETYGVTCLCEPSKVMTCDSCSCLEYVDGDTVAFGKWKMKLNKNLSKGL